MGEWRHIGPAVLAAFLASLVEFVEALTIVLAAGITRGWRSALTGAAAGMGTLVAATLTLGPAFAFVPFTILKLGAGLLLLLFGLRWLRKAVLRSAGVIALHDEEKIFSKESEAISGAGGGARRSGLDAIGMITAFKAVVIEGLEVVFIVITVGSAGKMFLPASAGAAAAGVLVIGMGVALRRPLTRIPENALKFCVGVLLSAFGVFWLGEGFKYPWPGKDLAVLLLIAAFFALSLIAVQIVKAATAGARI